MSKPMARDLVYEHILEQITAGRLSPHEKLEEKTISEMMEVSRTPVREALKKLEIDGYVTISPRKGCTVRTYSPSEIDDIYRILAKLEGLALELAAPHLGKGELSQLRKTTEKIEAAYRKNRYREAWEENLKFHFLIAHLSGNGALEELIRQSRRKVHLYRYFQVTIGRMDEYAHDHWGILDALGKKEFGTAGKRMESHVDRIRRIISDFHKNIS